MFNFLSFKQRKAAVKLRFHYSKQKYDDSVARESPPKNQMLCAHIMHGDFSGTFPDYTILFGSLKLMSAFILEKLLVYKIGDI